MKTIPTKNGELLCVEVPMEAYDFKMDYESEGFPILRFNSNSFNYVSLHWAQFEIIGTITNGQPDIPLQDFLKALDLDSLNEFLKAVAEYSGKKIVILSKK